MQKGKTNITINLQTTIDDDGEQERHSMKQTGSFFNRDELDVITFTELTDDNETIQHFLSIHPHKVNIKRSGAVATNQQFLVNQATECMLQHPHGTIHMETVTDSITYESIRNKPTGKLLISYRVKLNGQTERNHQLQLTYMKENAK